MSIPKYPIYKQSSVSWLETVPSHWHVLRLKQACEVFPSNVDKHSRDDEPQALLCNYTDVYYNERITADMSFMAATASVEQIARFTLKGGDTIITKDSETADDIAIAAYVPEDLPGVVCGYHLSVVRPRTSTCGAFVKRLFDSFYVKAKFAVAANGLTRVGLGQYTLDNIELPFPPLEEQLEIAAFLDRETAKIDDLIKEQKRLIELLKEKRQAEISRAITKGLNPNVPMRDSGVSWLGRVPAHWTKKRLKALFRQEKRQGYPHKDVLSVYREFGVILKDSRTDNFNKTPVDVSSYQLVEPGDLVVNKMKAWQGSLGISDLSGITSPDYVVFVPLHGDSAVYLHLLLRSKAMVSMYLSISNGIRLAQWRIEPEAFLTQLAFLPPAEEQYAIASFLIEQASKWDALIAEAEAAIDLLQQRRSALISAAVTGKIDVRGLMPQPEAVAA